MATNSFNIDPEAWANEALPPVHEAGLEAYRTGIDVADDTGETSARTMAIAQVSHSLAYGRVHLVIQRAMAIYSAMGIPANEAKAALLDAMNDVAAEQLK